MDMLDEGRLTQPERFFVRCHGPIPRQSEASYRLRVDGLVERPLELTLDDLHERWPATHLEAALICAGNRRAGLSRVEPTRSPLQWQGDAVGNALWAGASLAAVLAEAGIKEGALHVAFEGADATPDRGDGVRFGGSIPLGKALDGSVLLAYEMGGHPLLPEHGHPVRALVPGYVGARSVKWLIRITVQDEPSQNPFHARDYRLFPPDVREEDADFEQSVPLGETPLDSSITYPVDGALLTAGRMVVRGYALAGGQRTIERVEVSRDGGSTWHEASVVDGSTEPERRWRWRRWEIELEVPAGEHELAVRAWDSEGDTQPADPAAIWNFAGYANNSWHRVRVSVAED